MLGYAIVLVLLGGAWAWSLFGPLADVVFEQQRESLHGIAKSGVLALDAGLDPQEVVDGLVADTDLRATIVAADGTVLADSEERASEMENHADRPEVRAALDGETGSDSRLSATQDVAQLYVAVPGRDQGEIVAVRVSRPLDRIDALAARSRATGLLLLAAALAASLFVAYRASVTSTEPVQRLAASARAIAAGDVSAPVPREEGELGVVSEALAHLREQIRERVADLESERRDLRTVLNGLSDAVLLVESGTVRLANHAATELFGAPTLGWRDTPLDGSPLPDSLLGQASERLGEGAAATWDWGPDPRQRYLRAAIIPLSADTPDPRALLVIADVTERRRLDDVRRNFVANASHELKTPTTGIQLLAESAQAAFEDRDDDRAAGFVGQIRDESARLRQLIEDLLDLSRLETPASGAVMTDVRRVIDVATVSHRPAARARELRFETDLSGIEGQDVFAAADPTDVAIALDNLLDNAVRYTERGSVRVAVTTTRETVSIEVTDTGIGIPTDEQDRVFERFYRVDAARSRATGGTGLGLSLVRHAVQRSGGSISLESTPDEGTSATVRFTRVL